MTVKDATNQLLDLMTSGAINPDAELGFFDYTTGLERFYSPIDFIIETDQYGNQVVCL